MKPEGPTKGKINTNFFYTTIKMPTYYKKKTQKTTNSATSNRTSTVRPSRRRYGARSNTRTQRPSRRPTQHSMARPSASTLTPFTTRLLQLEALNRMASTNSAPQEVPTTDTKSTTVTSQSPSQTQTETQPQLQQSSLVPHQPSPSQVLPLTASTRHRLQPRAPLWTLDHNAPT